MTLKIDNAIEEIERALAGNKPKYANDIYLNNAIRYLQEIKSPSLADDQQVVLEYLKSRYHDRAFPFDLVGGLNSRFFSGPDWETDKVLKAYGGLNSREQFQVLAAFAEWGSNTLNN